MSATVLGLGTSRLLREVNRRTRTTAIYAVVALPPCAVVSAFCGFLVYALWCEVARGVDSGIGDSWQAPFGSGYSLLMIDIPDSACVVTPSGGQLGNGIRRIGYDDRTIVMDTETEGFLLIEKLTGRTTTFSTLSDLETRLRSIGSGSIALKSPDEVYWELRWKPIDLVAIPLVLLGPVVLAIVAGFILLRAWIEKDASPAFQ